MYVFEEILFSNVHQNEVNLFNELRISDKLEKMWNLLWIASRRNTYKMT